MSPIRYARTMVEIPQLGIRFGLAVVTAIFTSAMLRYLILVVASVSDAPAWAADTAHAILALSIRDFVLACIAGTMGGLASLAQEFKRGDPTRASGLTGAVGHLVIAQFATLMAYLGAVQEQLPVPAGLLAAGSMGWMGAAGLDWFGRRASQLLGLGVSPDTPPKP